MRRTLLLDLDGTLVDSVPDLRASLNRLMAALGLPPFTGPDVAAMVGDGAAALVRKAAAARGRAATAADVEAFLLDYTANAATQTRPYSQAAETLDRLLAQGWRIGICTNKPVAPTRVLLAALGLLDRIAAIGGGDSYPVRKPDPRHLLNLLDDLGATVDDAVMVGDHHNDVTAARGAGLPCIFAAWGYGPVKMAEGAVAVAHDIAELPGLLSRLA